MTSQARFRSTAFVVGLALLGGACGGGEAATTDAATLSTATTDPSPASTSTTETTVAATVADTTTTTGTTASEQPDTDSLIRVIWDDDGSPDGVIALMYLMAHPGIEVEALTVSVGEAYPSVFAPLLTRMLALVGEDVPVAAGLESPLMGSNQFPEDWRVHTSNFWNIALPGPVRPIESISAGQLIVNRANASQEPFVLFVSGSLTNLADALRLDPLISSKVRQVVIMGGALNVDGNLDEGYPELGNTTAEWNIWIDPLAAQEVLSSGIPVLLVPLDATNQVTWSRQQVAPWEATGTAHGQLAAALQRWALGAMGRDEFFVWDLVAAVAIDRPDLCVSEETHLAVITTPGGEQGRVVADSSQPANAVVCLDPDPGALREHVELVFAGAPPEELAAPKSGEVTEETPGAIPIAGTWQGTIESLDSDFSDDLTLVLEGDCSVDGICGTFQLTGADCRGDVQLLDAAHPTYTFLEILRSGGDYCIDGGLETLTLDNPGTLSYHFEYQTQDGVTESVGTLTLAATPSFGLRRPTPAAFDFVNAAVPGSFAHVRIVVDIDRDGWEDILLPAIFWDDRVGQPNPIAIWRGVGPASWREDTEALIVGPVPSLTYPRKGLVSDFNGDGWPDVYIADTGLDEAPFPGALNLLMLSDGSGRLRATEIPDESIGFHHGATAGDVDGDGDADLVVTDDARQPCYVLSNDGTGRFERHDDWIPADLQDRPFFTTELVDFDGDGNLDLFLGGHEWDQAPTVVLWGNDSGDYSSVDRTVIPPVDGFGTVVDLAAGDLNGDGRIDLVVDRTGSWPPPRFYDGYLLQVLLQTDVRRFTEAVGDPPVTADDWLEWVFAVDADNDGDLDLVVDPPQRGLTWWNNGAGEFHLGP